MTPQRWGRIREVFGVAIDTAESHRSTFLDSACEGDPELRHDIERLLAAHRSGTLATPLSGLLADEVPLSPGDKLGHYRIESLLGVGGMGVVYKAFDTSLHRDVALKILTAAEFADPEQRQQLIREARAASVLNHPNIVTVYEIGSSQGVDFISMEYIEGQSLRSAISAGGIPMPQILEYGIEIADALAKAHAAGLIHRDLKPANMMVTSEGRIKLLDFGLALQKPKEESEIATTTAPGEIVGTLGYMSPEQLRGLPLDARTDLFSFGVVLYEMAFHSRPFTGDSAGAVCEAILNDPPREFEGVSTPDGLKTILHRLLRKPPAERYATAGDVAADLKKLQRSLSPVRVSPKLRFATIAAALVLVLLGGWFWYRTSRERWALRTAIPETQRLIAAEEFVKAVELLEQARAIVPGNPTVERFWNAATSEMSVDTVPPDADVSIRLYESDPNEWKPIGKSPVQKLRVARGDYVIRLVKPGFTPQVTLASIKFDVSPPGYHYPMFNLRIKLRTEGSVPHGMVPAAGGLMPLTFPISAARPVKIQDFLVDRTEVTNQDYKKFVDSGGYRKREFWKQPFIKDGRELSWERGIAFFHDRTGRPGPSTWEAGSFAAGREKYPVAGVSWFEAAAYAAFSGRSLPTAFHWVRASQAQGFPALIPAHSNFGTALKPVGLALSGHGTTDMAGNVKEWGLNENAVGKRLIFGGGIGEPEYNFSNIDAQSPWERRENYGFRCVQYDSGAPEPAAAARIDVKVRDYWREIPVSAQLLEAYKAEIQYDNSDLNARVEETSSIEDGTRQRITFDAAYGHERVPAYLFLPNGSPQPVQIVVYFPGGFAFFDDKLDLTALEQTRARFLLKSGRGLIMPIYKGTYERHDGFNASGPIAAQHDHAITFSRDLARTIDYLQTRPDIDASRIAYFGDSGGVPNGVRLLAIEGRVKVAIFATGGLQQQQRYLPAADPFNYVRHLKIPVLMINGRFDGTFPLETSQRPLFELLGAPVANKKHIVYEIGHGFPYQAVPEVLDWLDKYLGPVQRSDKQR